MKRNKLLQVKKFMIKRQMLGDFQNSLVLSPLDAHKRNSSDNGSWRTPLHWMTGSIEHCNTFLPFRHTEVLECRSCLISAVGVLFA